MSTTGGERVGKGAAELVAGFCSHPALTDENLLSVYASLTDGRQGVMLVDGSGSGRATRISKGKAAVARRHEYAALTCAGISTKGHRARTVHGGSKRSYARELFARDDHPADARETRPYSAR